MVQDNPWNEVWRILSLVQTKLNILGKYSNWTKFRKMILTPLIDINNLNPIWNWTFVVIDDKGGEKQRYKW
jgi:hypothetical protein